MRDSAVAASRGLARKALPEVYGWYLMQFIMPLVARRRCCWLAGDDRYETKVYNRAESSAKERPILVPSPFPEKIFGCVYEPDSSHVTL
ncbi:unnamed protein product [Heligmosomoides polygyrus]|uniref:Transposase n=1 Tax=Heligmosomoides polygyrus TaxID=6339 RepID=A0A183G4Q5_HELPZ|nr:unnamed protein product [Heligmosomoides polygyrus]